jgi:hypothetical protein
VKKIRIPSNVEFIGANCFRQCHSLCEVIFESGSKLQRIEEYAFHGTGVKMIRIPSSVEFIGKECFSWCGSLCEITFEGNVKLIENDAFTYCWALKCVKVPCGVSLKYDFPRECQIEYI